MSLPSRLLTVVCLAAGLAAQTPIEQRPVRDSLVTADTRNVSIPGYDLGSFVAFFLEDIGSEFFVFTPDGELVEFDDGTALLSGRIVDREDANCAFAVEFRFSGRVPDGTVPSGSPYRRLVRTLYSDEGGPIDPATFRYYTGVEGTLFGLEKWAGAVLEATKFGDAMQLGAGAGNLNVFPGLSWWFDYDTVQQPDDPNETLPSSGMGDGMLEIGFGGYGCIGIAKPAERGPYTVPGIPFDKNLILADGINNLTTFRFRDCGTFGQYQDGEGRLAGLLVDENDPTSCLMLHVRFSGLVNPGDPPPPNSPVKGLLPAGYVENGGPVDPATWQYYTEISGIAVGCRGLEGALIKLTRRYAAYQLGEGANNVGVAPGGSAWFTVEVCRQPDNGPPLNVTQGELIHTLNECLLANGSFEERPGFVARQTLSQGSNALAPWSITGNVDVYNDHFEAADGPCCIDLAGTAAGGIEQEVPTVVGMHYRVIFMIAANVDCSPAVKTMRVSAAGTFQDFTVDGTGHTRNDLGWQEVEFAFTATAATTTVKLQAGAGATACNALVDKIRIMPDSISDAVDLGPSCSPRTTFSATKTYLGEASALTLDSAPNAPAALLFNTFAPAPVDLLNCRFYVDLGTMQSLPIGATDNSGHLTSSFPVPYRLRLTGLHLTMQALTAVNGGELLMFAEMSNGYRLTVGVK